MAPLRSFQDVLAAAISDVVEHGFDSVERIDRWKRELTDAARRAAGDPLRAEQDLKDALAAIYRRNVDELGLLRHHQGEVPRFTIERVKPQLRAELDRRIKAAASLIRNHRETAIPDMERRFEGWATSIPRGGVSAEKRAAVKADVQKSLKQLPFEQRRVAIDQGHKMVGALSEILAADGGAIAGVWRSHWRQAGYDYREDHKERDGRVFLIRDSWAHQAGLVKRSANGYYDEVDAVGQKVFCRCYMTWLYALRDLPADMLTQKGRRALTEVGLHTNATRAFSRADSAEGVCVTQMPSDPPIPPEVLDRVVAADRLEWMAAVRAVEVVPDGDPWHASEDRRVVQLERKFFALPPVEQAHTLLHELGHVGQDGDPETWQAFLRAHGGRARAFEQMANRAHLEDWERRGQVEGGMASEVFAESYARFCLGNPVPTFLADFWRSRITGLLSQSDARYFPWWPGRPTRCARCAMFAPGISPLQNTCAAVSGDIARTGHCKLFRIDGARADSAEAEPRPMVGYAAMERRLERLRREAERLLT